MVFVACLLLVCQGFENYCWLFYHQYINYRATRKFCGTCFSIRLVWFDHYDIFHCFYEKYFVGKRNSFVNVNRSLFFFNRARNTHFYCYSIFFSIIDIREYVAKALKSVYSLNFVVDSDFFFAVFYDRHSYSYSLCINHLFIFLYVI